MNIVIVEKRINIGEIKGQNIFTWEFFDAIRSTRIREWSLNRGFTVPEFGVTRYYVELEQNFRCQMWEV